MNPSLLFATALYSLFVIYGSLVPLEFNNALPFETAVSQFENIRLLHIGTEHRADWIANILLYIPLAFGASASFSGIKNPLLRTLISASILASGIGLAFAIEFTQLFFPPRTVSINDLVAESIGTFVGILGWQFSGSYFSNLYRHLLHSSLFSAQAAIIFYVLIYSASCLFPFDFVTSMDELNAKLQIGNDTFFLNTGNCRADSLRCGIKLSVEILAFLPLGILFCYLPYLQSPMVVTLMFGFFLGSLIEGTQVFLLSGEGQGFSVLTRMIGIAAGVHLFLWAKKQSFDDIVPLLRRTALFAIPVYVLVALSINGISHWITTEQALVKLSETRFLPLYYFYYTTEGLAFQSLISNVGLYMPVGFLAWAKFLNTDSEHKKLPHWFFIGLVASLFATVVETEKLFLANKHVDPSDVWLAFFAAAGCYTLMNNLLNWIRYGKTSLESLIAQQFIQEETPPPLISHIVESNNESVESVLPLPEISKNWRGASFLFVTLIIIALFNYPIGAIWLGLFLVGYATLLLYFPFAWLIVLPALLPIMDFAPYTGRFFFDEFDLVILTTLAFYFWQKPKLPNRSLLSASTILVLITFSILYVVSLLIGLFPLTEWNANAFNNYYSHYNALRVGKGFIWSLLLLPLFQLTIRRYRYAPQYFSSGILLGLTGVSVFVIIERLVFPGLFDFTTDYRVTALFSTTHAGGGHIESYLMLSMPFLTLLFVNSKHPFSKFLGIFLFVISLHALLVTYARGGYIGFGISFAVLFATLLIGFKQKLRFTKNSLFILPLVVITAAMMIPVLQSSVVQQRFSVASQDKDSRAFHWHDALEMRDDDVTTALFGMGLGSYPRTFFWLNNENTHPATYEIDTENGNNYLRLRGGDALYLGQYLPINSHKNYRLIMDVRSEKENLNLSTMLCEKSLQYSLRCSNGTGMTLSKKTWEHIEQTIDSNDVGELVAGFLKRPIQLSFYNGNGFGKSLDVDNVQLIDETGMNLLKNGDFSKGSDFWFFSAEKHNPSHIFNFWVHLLFDQGWLGLILFAFLFIKGIYNCCRRLPRSNVFSVILLTSFSGFMVVGFVDSPFDAPRLTLLFFLLLFFALMRTPRSWSIT